MVNFQNVKQGKLPPALAASIVLHLLLLWPAASPNQKDDEIGQSLSVILRPQTGLLGTSGPATSPDASPRAIREARAYGRAAPAPHAVAQPLLKDIAPDSEPAADAETSSLAGSRPGGATIERDATRQAANGPATRGLDADGVRQYRMALAVEARRFKRYPRRALADELVGTVEVRVAVSAGGQPQEIALAKSSGHESLDDAALEMMRKAASRAAVPEMLRRGPFVVNLPVVFDVASE